MNRLVIVAAFLASCLFAVPVFAQPGGSPGRGQGRAGAGQGMPGAVGQRAGARLARLGLDAATAQKVQQVHQKYRTERQPIRQQLQTHRQRLAQLLRSDSNDQSAYRSALTGLQNARKQLRASTDREVAELQQVLTPKQQAQMLGAMRRGVHQGKQRGGQAPRGQRGPKRPGAKGGARLGR